MPEIIFKNVTKMEGKRVLLKELNVTVKDKEFLSLLGPPGSGKSYLLKLIAGIERPDRGEIYIDGKLVNDVEPVARGVSMMFQSLALFPHLTVFNNLAFPLRKTKMSEEEIKQRVSEIAELLKIGQLLERRPAQLSGGEKQRASLGRALVPRSGVALLDEPLGHLDAKLRVYARSEIKRIQRQLGQTVIMSTVDTVDATSVADRVGLMSKGQLVQLDTPSAILVNPVNLFVATSIGFPPLNILKATLRQGNGTLTLETAAFKLDLARLENNLGGMVGRELEMGVRPGDVRVAIDGGAGITGKVEIIEPIGAESILTLNVNGVSLIAKVPASLALSLRGKSVTLQIPIEKLLLFDSDGRNILHQAAT
jgi:multiple sugar transport system ATP-binding protein